MNVDVRLNKEIIERCKKEGISVDFLGSCLFILFCLFENKEILLEHFDDKNKGRRALILYRYLESRLLIKRPLHESNYLYEIAKKGVDLVKFVQSKMDLHAENFVEKEKKEQKTNQKQDYEWIKEYLNLFPLNLRDNKKVVLDRMITFMRTFPEYTPEVILKATKRYLKEQEFSKSGHDFTRRSQYFIYKGAGNSRIWDLASWCEKEISDKKEEFDLDNFNTV